MALMRFEEMYAYSVDPKQLKSGAQSRGNNAVAETQTDIDLHFEEPVA